MNYELGEVILERDFESRDADGNVAPIKLRVGKPLLDEGINNSDPILWYCPYQMLGTTREKIFIVRGQDALDALLMSLKMAHADLYSFAKGHHKKVTWLGEDYLGLPAFESPRI